MAARRPLVLLESIFAGAEPGRRPGAVVRDVVCQSRHCPAPVGDGLCQKDQAVWAEGWNLLFKLTWIVPRLNPLGQSHI